MTVRVGRDRYIRRKEVARRITREKERLIESAAGRLVHSERADNSNNVNAIESEGRERIKVLGPIRRARSTTIYRHYTSRGAASIEKTHPPRVNPRQSFALRIYRALHSEYSTLILSRVLVD